MKRIIVSIEEMVTKDSVYNAYRKTVSGSKGDREDARRFALHETENLKKLNDALIDGTWQASSGHTYRHFTEHKWRDITTFPIEDRIVHRLVVNYFRFDRFFIRRTFGSIRRRGTLAANKNIRCDLYRSGYKYVLITDARKYYPNILKSTLKGLIRLKYKGKRAIDVVYKIIDAYLPDGERGMSIGALVSQDMGNLYYTPIENFILCHLHLKYYTRMVDNTATLFRSKRQAACAIPLIVSEAARYGIVFGQLQLFPIYGRKIDFAGYTVDANSISRLRPSTLRNFTRRLRRLSIHPMCSALTERSVVCSYLGLLKHCNGTNITNILKSDYHEIFNRIDRCASYSRQHQESKIGTPYAGRSRVQSVLQ